jgi:hypothetical protein
MDEEDGRLGPQPGHIIGNGAYLAKYGTRQQDGFQDPGESQRLIDVTGGRALKLGRFDVLTDASTKSLRHRFKQDATGTSPNPGIGCPLVSSFWRHGRPAYFKGPIPKNPTQYEVTYENVPGK